MSDESNTYIVKTSFFGLLTALTTITFKILITNKTKDYNTNPTSHPYLICLLFFIGKSINLIVFFFSDASEETEEELPLPKLTPNVSSNEISLPKIDFSNFKGDYTLNKSKYPSSKRLPLSMSITLLPSFLHYISVLLKCYALSSINTGLYQFIFMTLTLNTFTVEFYNKTNTITKQTIISYVIAHVCIIIGIIYYLIINEQHQCMSIVLICISNVLHYVVLYMNTIIIMPTTITTVPQLYGTEGLIALVIGLIVLICSCNIYCVDNAFTRTTFCGGHNTIEQFKSFFSNANYDSGTRYLIMCVFVICVFIYYYSEQGIKVYSMYHSNTAMCVVNLIIACLVWALFTFVEGFGIVKEQFRVVDVVIGVIMFITLLMGGFVFELQILASQQGNNGVIKEAAEEEEDERDW